MNFWETFSTCFLSVWIVIGTMSIDPGLEYAAYHPWGAEKPGEGYFTPLGKIVVGLFFLVFGPLLFLKVIKPLPAR